MTGAGAAIGAFVGIGLAYIVAMIWRNYERRK